jgi:hypothetical protein
VEEEEEDEEEEEEEELSETELKRVQLDMNGPQQSSHDNDAVEEEPSKEQEEEEEEEEEAMMENGEEFGRKNMQHDGEEALQFADPNSILGKYISGFFFIHYSASLYGNKDYIAFLSCLCLIVCHLDALFPFLF